MSLVACWLLFPAILCVLGLGFGLLIKRVAAVRLPGVLLLPAGFAGLIAVGQLTTAFDATAELTTPFALVLGSGGVVLSRDRLRLATPDRWAAGAAVMVFAAFAAPIVLSGQANFAGYIKLDDTATWMAFTDWVMHHGSSVSGLQPSSYEATLAVNLQGGYPIGGFVPLGIGLQLSGQDVAWTIQPFMALCGAMLALALAGLLEPLVKSRRLLAVVVVVSAQPALLFGYYLWGGIKEMESAVLLALIPSLAVIAVRPGVGKRAVVPLAVTCAAVLGVLGLGAGVWLVAFLAPAAVIAMRDLGTRLAVRRAAVLVGLSTVLSLPVVVKGLDAIFSGGAYSPTGSNLPGNPLGNLIGPLNPLEVAGIWPAADFRVDPHALTVTYLLVGVVAATASLGIWFAVQGRKWALPIYLGGLAVGGLVIAAVGIPWVDGKVFATASPGLLCAAGAAAAMAITRGRRAVGVGVLGILAIGVLWSNGLAYTQVNLAPRGELKELEDLGHRIKGQGPTLVLDGQIYAVRHFLRDADPEGVGELRRRTIPLRSGGSAEGPLTGGTDDLAIPDLFIYRTIVIRKSPSQSRPPSPYVLVDSGRYYEVWQIPAGTTPKVAEHLPLGSQLDPGAVPDCREVHRLATVAGPTGQLVAAEAALPVSLPLTEASHPPNWETGSSPYLVPDNGAGVIEARIPTKTAGRFTVWIGGSIRGTMSLVVDGRNAGSVRHYLLGGVGYTPLGSVTLHPGAHLIELRYGGRDWRPGSGKSDTLSSPIGPLVLSPEGRDLTTTRVKSADAGKLCGKRWDWIEALR